MGKHKPCVMWPVKPVGKYPNAYVQTVDDQHISFSIFKVMGEDGFSVQMERKFARMLAKRINQALDATLSKGGCR